MTAPDPEPVPADPCPATLRHAHGMARCDLRGRHDEHGADCDACWEDGDPARLTWTETHEDWLI